MLACCDDGPGFAERIGGDGEMVKHWAIPDVLTGSQEVPGLDGLGSFVWRVSWCAGGSVVGDTELGFGSVEVAEEIGTGGIFTFGGIAITSHVEGLGGVGPAVVVGIGGGGL